MLQEYPQTWQLPIHYVSNNLGTHLHVERIGAISLETPVVDRVMNDIDRDCIVSIVCMYNG